MRFCRFEAHGETAYGVVEGDLIRRISGTPFGDYEVTDQAYGLSEVRLLAPSTPGKMLAMALNYASHLSEEWKAPEKPEPFFKTPNALIGPGDAIVLPRDAGRVDAEAELVVVIGRRCRKVSPDEALDYVLGYTCGNDVSAREWQRGDIQWWRAKASDTFGPVGPFIVTDVDGQNLNVVGRINGEEVQRCNTSEMLFNIPTIISFISRVVTLEPGDLIFTGTSGRPAQIKDGDVVEVEVEGVGVLRNPVRAEA